MFFLTAPVADDLNRWIDEKADYINTCAKSRDRHCNARVGHVTIYWGFLALEENAATGWKMSSLCLESIQAPPTSHSKWVDNNIHYSRDAQSDTNESLFKLLPLIRVREFLLICLCFQSLVEKHLFLSKEQVLWLSIVCLCWSVISVSMLSRLLVLPAFHICRCREILQIVWA